MSPDKRPAILGKLEEAMNHAEIKGQMINVAPGQALFFEGDDSQDLYILVNGRLDVLKGDVKISEIVESGAVFGEMSLLLQTKRTATVKAASPSQVACVPRESVPRFFVMFPEVVQDTSRLLAKRLEEASKALYGLKEFADQLPDAVVITDAEGRIVTINATAARLYGCKHGGVRNKPVEELYHSRDEFRKYLGQVRTKNSMPARVFLVDHPKKGLRYFSVSMSTLKDGRGRYQGVLSLARDVTSSHKLENRLRRILYWGVPIMMLATLAVGSYFYFYPQYRYGTHVTDGRQKELRNQLGKDYVLLRSLLLPFFRQPEKQALDKLLLDFFQVQEKESGLYIGIVLLDQNKKVLHAFCAETGQPCPEMVGTTYGHIEFKGRGDSLHKVLTLYRRDKLHPQGYKGVELAFEVRDKDEKLGWLVFQMRAPLLESEFGVTDEDLTGYRFSES